MASFLLYILNTLHVVVSCMNSYGGGYASIEIPAQIRHFSDMVMRKIEHVVAEKQLASAHELLYARLDLMNLDTTTDIDCFSSDASLLASSDVEKENNWVVGEVELVEPFLYMTPQFGFQEALEGHAQATNRTCRSDSLCVPANKLAEAIYLRIKD